VIKISNSEYPLVGARLAYNEEFRDIAYTDQFGKFILNVSDTNQVRVKLFYENPKPQDFLYHTTLNDIYAAKSYLSNEFSEYFYLYSCHSTTRLIQSITEEGFDYDHGCVGKMIYKYALKYPVNNSTFILTPNNRTIRARLEGDYDDSFLLKEKLKESKLDINLNRKNEVDKIIYEISSKSKKISQISAIQLSFRIPEPFNDDDIIKDWVKTSRMKVFDLDYNIDGNRILTIYAIRDDSKKIVTDDYLFRLEFPYDGNLNNENRDSSLTLNLSGLNRFYTQDRDNKNTYTGYDVKSLSRSLSDELIGAKIHSIYRIKSGMIRLETEFPAESTVMLVIYDFEGKAIPQKYEIEVTGDINSQLIDYQDQLSVTKCAFCFIITTKEGKQDQICLPQILIN